MGLTWPKGFESAEKILTLAGSDAGTVLKTVRTLVSTVGGASVPYTAPRFKCWHENR